MKRREFIQSSGSLLAATALIGLPEIVNGKNLTQDTLGKVVLFESKLESKSAVERVNKYKISLNSNAINNFKSSSNSDKKLTLSLFYNNDNTYKNYNFIVTKVKKIKGATTMYKVQSKYLSKDGTTIDILTEFKKKVYFNIELKEPFAESSLQLINKKKKTIAELKPVIPSTNTGGGGCYITTACTVVHNLPDNCYELETLRSFRDNYIAHTTEGINWIKMYYNEAPKLVNRINSHEKSQEIYEYIYENLVKQSVKLVEEKEYNDAFVFYKNCVIELNKII